MIPPNNPEWRTSTIKSDWPLRSRMPSRRTPPKAQTTSTLPGCYTPATCLCTRPSVRMNIAARTVREWRWWSCTTRISCAHAPRTEKPVCPAVFWTRSSYSMRVTAWMGWTVIGGRCCTVPSSSCCWCAPSCRMGKQGRLLTCWQLIMRLECVLFL